MAENLALKIIQDFSCIFLRIIIIRSPEPYLLLITLDGDLIEQ